MDYQAFINSKKHSIGNFGFEPTWMPDCAFDFQAHIITKAVRKGRIGMFADTGLGKTLMQVEWARLSGATSLIVAPLAVCTQTVREAATVGVKATYVRDPAQMTGPGLYVTNYEMVGHFDPDLFDAVVLDEASILKQSDGKTRTKLIAHFRETPDQPVPSGTDAAGPAEAPASSRRGSSAAASTSSRGSVLQQRFRQGERPPALQRLSK
jgi:hypothetical protein